MNDKTPLRELKGVGEKTEKLFQKIGITTAEASPLLSADLRYI